MIKDITLGQYFPGNSLIHRLDPRMKIILTVLYIVALFMASSAVSYVTMVCVTAFLIALSGVPLKFYFRGLKSLLFIICFTAILNIFYTSGTVIAEFWIFKITLEGVVNAVSMMLRITMMVVGMSVLTYTTSPLLLTGGLERLLSPLKVIKVPVHEFAMIMTIALRFIPTLLEETNKIMNAQKARGADLESGGLIKRAKALVPILIPLFVSAFRRADDLAVAMECRCYNGDSKERTRYVRYRLCGRDYVSLVFCFCVAVAVFFLNRILVYGL